jgi:hypothetical protein
MKKMKRGDYWLLFLGGGFLMMMGLFLLSTKEAKTGHPTGYDHPDFYMPAQIISAPMPEQVEFCGQTIPLNRLDMRERFDREINSFAYFHSTTLLYLKRANRYFPIIEPLLRKNGIPDDFKYLCVIESSLDIRALSPANAAGLWQFMESTGKDFGLEINTEVDERYHVEKATEAACHYLKAAYAQYGDWVNVAASYNAGMGKITSSLNNQQVRSAFDLLLVQETSRYIFRILAIKQLFENPSNYGFMLKKEDLYPSVPVQRVAVNQTIENIASFAQSYDLNYLLLKEFNPWLRNTKLTVRSGKSYEIAIPAKDDLYFDTNKIKVHNVNWLRK